MCRRSCGRSCRCQRPPARPPQGSHDSATDDGSVCAAGYASDRESGQPQREHSHGQSAWSRHELLSQGLGPADDAYDASVSETRSGSNVVPVMLAALALAVAALALWSLSLAASYLVGWRPLVLGVGLVALVLAGILFGRRRASGSAPGLRQ